jgi:Fe-S cluster biogenesis protein NfuA
VSLARAFAGRVRRGLVRGANDVLDRIEAWAGEPSSRPTAPTARVSPFATSAALPPAPVAAPSAPSGPQLSFDEVQAVLEDMVRPALQSDGGDIVLLRVQNNDVFVQLVGACTTCSSSTVTMRGGVERLLREEFPHFGELHEVSGPA